MSWNRHFFPHQNKVGVDSEQADKANGRQRTLNNLAAKDWMEKERASSSCLQMGNVVDFGRSGIF
jgi:hypothetical protein